MQIFDQENIKKKGKTEARLASRIDERAMVLPSKEQTF